MHSIGLSVSPTSIHNKKKNLIKKHEEDILSLVSEYKNNKVTQTIQENVVPEIEGCSPSTSDHSAISKETVSAEPSHPSESEAMHPDSDPILSSENSCCSDSQTSNETVSNTSTQTPVQTVKSLDIEVLGDNLDLTITPACMALDRQRKSLHWFLVMVKRNRVSFDTRISPDNECYQENVSGIGTAHWIPSEEHISNLKQNFVFHVSKILKKHVNELENIPFPQYIDHDYMHLTKQKSDVLNCELIEESENSSTGMIKILQHIHEIVVPHIDNKEKLADRVVFGGDVLTNERAFSAQAAMQNNSSDFDCLKGVIHRPEGLHRQFNFLSVCHGQLQVQVLFLVVQQFIVL